jgi:hypothetical protein
VDSLFLSSAKLTLLLPLLLLLLTVTVMIRSDGIDAVDATLSFIPWRDSKLTRLLQVVLH